jgi:hypothetical protein
VNYKITRIRLASIGHAQARFDPLPLDLRGDTGNEAVDTVILLQNTGGKTVLLRLLFSVLCPSAADKIGPPVYDANGRPRPNLPVYLTAADTGHVAIEWRPCEGDAIVGEEVLITGMAAQYRGHRVTNRLSDVERHWYLAKSDDGAFTIDDLPFADAADRPYSLSGFTGQLEALERRAAAAARRSPFSIRGTPNQTKWQALLEDIGLDPVLFEYQAQMNRTEGSAGNIFSSWRTDLHFVQFLLEMLTPAETLESLTNEVRDVLAKLRNQPALRLEHDFVAGAVPPLDVVVAAHADLAAARDEQQRTRGEARVARARFEAAAEADERQLEALGKAATDAGRQKGDADRERRRLEDEARAYRYSAAAFRHAAAAEALAGASDESAEADLASRAWPVVPTVRRLRVLDGSIDAAAEAVRKTDEAAAPLRAERNAAALAYRQHLEAARVIAIARANAEKDAAEGLANEATELDRAARDAGRAAEKARADALALRDRLRDVAAQRVQALAKGALASADEPAAAAIDRHQGALGAAAARLDRIRERETGITARTNVMADEGRVALEVQATARAAAADLGPRINEALAEDARLSGAPRVLALTDEEPDLDLVGLHLAERLRSAASAADRERIAMLSRTADDRRAQAALADTGLLPGPTDTERAITLLRNAGFAGAKLGLHYLDEAVRPEFHERAIRRVPWLAGGIVLPDADQVDAARERLADAGLASLHVLTIGLIDDLVAAGEIDEEPAEAHHAVVPPAGGTHDRAAAVAARAELTARLDEAEQTATELETRAGADRKLGLEIEAHLRAWGSGELATQQEVLDAHRLRLTEAEQTLGALATEQGRLIGESKALREEADRLSASSRAAERAIGTLEALAEAERQTSGAQARITELDTEADGWDAIETASVAEAGAKRVSAGEATAREAQLRTDASGFTARAEPVTVDAPVVVSLAEATVLAAADGEALRTLFESRDALLAKRTTGSREAARLEQFRHERGSVAADLDAVNPGVRERAERLERDEAARTRDGIALATEQADARRKRAADELLRATTDEQRTREARDLIAAEGRRADFAPGDEPRDRFVADRRAAELGAAVALAYAAFNRHEATEAAATLEQGSVRDHLGAMTGSVALLGSLLIGAESDSGAPASIEPFVGNIAAATTLRDALLERHAAARSAIDDADSRLRRGQAALRDAIGAARFRDLVSGTAVGRQLDDVGVRPEGGERLLPQLVSRRDRLASDLAAMGIHREVLTKSLVGAAQGALAVLTAAQRRSHLPRDLGGWSGQEFLRIAYQRPGSPDEMAARLQVLVADYAQAGPDAVPEGLKLLMKTLETAVVGGFTVMVLKPNAGFEVEPIPIIEVGGLSGGARATAAVALMMMIAEMRSARRAASPCRVGPLILDNPFGSASALFLVDTQRKVAEASGIQLICTTGLLDPAIRPFRRHIGLSNSRAKGTHLRYVRADETILAVLRGEAESERIRGTSVIRTRIPAPIA